MNWEKWLLGFMNPGEDLQKGSTCRRFAIECLKQELPAYEAVECDDTSLNATIYIACKGVLEVCVRGEALKLPKAACLIVYPKVSHGLKNLSACVGEVISIGIDFPFAMMEDFQPSPLFPEYFNNVGYVMLRNFDIAEEMAKKLYDQLIQAQTAEDFGVKLMGCQLIYSIYTHISGSLMKRVEGSNLYVRKVIQLIEERPDYRWSTQQLAEQLHVSKYHLLHVFKQHTGQSLMDFVNTRRLNRSIQLLHGTSMKVNEIAAAVGIHDAHYFSAAFKKFTGMTPINFRKHLNSGAITRKGEALQICVNCGGGAIQNLSGDQAYSEGKWGYLGEILKFSVKKKVYPNFGLGSGMNSLVYTDIFWYRFDLPNGYYTVKLYFAELYFEDKGARCFDVFINGSPVLMNFDIFKETGCSLTGIEKIFPGIAVTSGFLQLEFSARVNLAQVNAIVIEAEVY